MVAALAVRIVDAIVHADAVMLALTPARLTLAFTVPARVGVWDRRIGLDRPGRGGGSPW